MLTATNVTSLHWCPLSVNSALVSGQVVIKSQILAGGRGLGHFDTGLKGGVHIVHYSKAAELAKQMLGNRLITKQSGPQGKSVRYRHCCMEQDG